MKNYGEDWFFEKAITVVNTRGSAETPAVTVPLKYEVAFFPEGGNLVENLSSKVAFRISDQYGSGIDCTGIVTEDDQDTVVRFRPLKFGIGSFTLTPRPGHRYRSTIRLSDGTAISNLLPTAYKEGMVMTVSEDGDDHIRVNVQSTAAGSVYLIAHTRRTVKVSQTAVLKEGKADFLIDRNSLGDGISHLTVFDGEKHPMCERLVFKQPSGQLHMGLSMDKESYATRQQVSVQVNAAAALGRQPLSADCSMSVFRVDPLQTAPAGDIAGYLYLTSDLKGRIESPEYYLHHPEDKAAIDNLMISHGWRRFRWEEVLRHSSPGFRYPPEYNGAIITGTVVNTRTGNVADDIQAYLSVPGTRTQFATDHSGGDGRVKFELKDFYGSQEIIVQTNPNNEDSMYRVDIDNPFLERYTDALLPPFILPPAYAAILSDKGLAAQVVNKYNGPRLKQLHFPAVDTTVFYYKPDYTYLLDDFTRFTTMEEVLREYVILMLVEKRRSHFHLPMYDVANSTTFDDDPLILLDGVPVFDIDKLMTIDPLKIRKLDMVHRKYFLGTANFDGIMNWITYKGDLGGYTLDPHATVVDYEGLQLEREFYSPSYAAGEAPESHLPDFRNVLYWSPDVVVDRQGKGQVSFYTSDIPGRYVAVVEGLAADGSAGSGMIMFEVR